MVDVSDKSSTTRTATATATVQIGPEITRLIKANAVKKGDVLTVSQLAGISGAKKTSELIPLCHNIPITNVNIDARLNEADCSVEILATVKSQGKTGVEMEALMAASVSALTVYDMCKSVSHDIKVTEVELLSKTGGASGDYHKRSIRVKPYETAPIQNKETVFVGAV